MQMGKNVPKITEKVLEHEENFDTIGKNFDKMFEKITLLEAAVTKIAVPPTSKTPSKMDPESIKTEQALSVKTQAKPSMADWLNK